MTKTSAKSKVQPLRTPDARVSALGIARATARDIERGHYLPGARLREQELADRFRCSRAPVREALRILESQGSVVIEPMKGARIATPEDAQFFEVFLIRRALAGLMAQQAALAERSETKSVFIEITSALPACAKTAADGHSFAAEVRKAIRALINVSNTPRTVQLVRSLTFGHEAFQDEVAESRKSRIAQAQLWAKLSKAVEIGDASAAREAMDAIFDYSRDYIETAKSKGRTERKPRSRSEK